MKDLSQCRILLVDDAKPNIDILVEALKPFYKLSVALSGEMALQIAERTPPDLVLLDIVMPGLDGYEVCRRFRKIPALADVPVIFLSSLDEVQNKAQGFEAGANDYVTKPFEILEVQARVHSLLKAKAYSDSVKEQLAADLRIAHDIQMGMIPQDFSALEKTFGVELAGVLEPTREVGGDLYCAFAADQDRLVLVMGDVSGKGIPASLFMVRASSLVRLLGRQIREPQKILATLNDELEADNPSGMFVTLICGVYERESRRLTLSNGGQCQPVLLRQGQAPCWAFPHLGTALGMESGMDFQQISMILEPGDTLVLYTDGVTEAFNEGQECYGDDRLLSCLGASTGKSAPAVCSALLQEVRAFANGTPQSDDIAMLALRVPGTARVSGAASAFKLDLQATPHEVMRAVNTLQQFCQAHRVEEMATHALMLSLEEMGSNIVNHAYQLDSNQQFWVAAQLAGDRVVVELRDRGAPFDPLQAPMPDPDEDLDERAEGGWGIQLVRGSVDELQYSRAGAENVLRFSRGIAGRRS